MITLHPMYVTWIVDPGPIHFYREANVQYFLEWLEEWEYDTCPSDRYHMLKSRIHFWGANHTFYIGLEDEEHADAFHRRWKGLKRPGACFNGKFVLI